MPPRCRRAILLALVIVLAQDGVAVIHARAPRTDVTLF